MRFATLLALLPAVAFAAPAAHEERAKIDDGTCISNGKYVGWWHNQFSYSGCQSLARDCETAFLAAGTHDPWSVKSCVAAATCWGPSELNVRLQCRDPTFEPSQAPTLNYANVYAPIVGDCAWQEGGCPITFQNFVDFVYGAISATGATSGYPDSVDVLREQYWSYIANWTATGDTIPYTNFNDWLFYSNA
ncbi:hypothetical protein CYLTODRAFT_424064 [Cylindrobasidium torrendii FP15055 ss-10]|uniref:Uncharacterized protein n=1 Tax=Cylindrobasidium torrendii FP15055 ss-10 TaxID=1314674 RepID=A0A0D7B6E5_9AGAR|nr:hypothetical protein CYLTODRAFT_424064 [Cylindrobasidium torrendii FP15055 ss-10]